MKEIAQKVLNMAEDEGVQAEAFLLNEKELSIEVNKEQVDTLKQAEEIGLGVRVIKGGSLGFAYTSDLQEKAIRSVVTEAINIASYTSPDENNILPKAQSEYPPLDFLYDRTFNEISVEEKIDMAGQVERAARNHDPRIRIVERAVYEDTDYSSLVMNTNGLEAYASSNFGGLFIFLVASENDDAQNGFSVMVKRKWDDLDPAQVGIEAARNALRSLNPKTIDSAKLPCILEPYIMTRFMNLIAAMVNAHSVQKGKSLFADKVGKSVASPVFNLLDNGRLPEGIASFPFDGEGVRTTEKQVIAAGILQGFLYDTYTASKAGINSTGNAARGSFRGLPSVGTTNFILSAGENSAQELISSIDKGFYITEVMGMHTANPVSGDFSLGAAGLMIEKGRLTHAVRGVTIAGNLIDFLQDIEALGNDVRFFGSRAAPTVKLRALSIGGK